jgi:hypothetical protein
MHLAPRSLARSTPMVRFPLGYMLSSPRWAALLATGLTVLAGCSDSTPPAGPSGSSGGTAADASGAGDASGGADGDATSGNASDGSGTPDAPATSNDSATTDGGQMLDGAEADGGDSAVGLTLPIQRAGGLDVLEFGSLQFAVNPAIGARIVSFMLGGDELLTDATVNSTYWGSTLWTSPNTDWIGLANGLPPAAIDTDPYATTVSATGVITATSNPVTINGKTFTVTKVFTADIPNQAIVIDYKINNTGAATFSIAAWEVTRVFPGGLTFFQTGTTLEPNISPQIMLFQQALGNTWYDNATQLETNGDSQSFFDTPGGYLAHDAPNSNGDLLFIKTFPVITVAMAPPGQLPAAIYTSDDPDPHDYEEIEEHSAYTSIAPGATLTQTVHWYLRRLPIGTDRSAGSAALVAAVKAVIGK